MMIVTSASQPGAMIVVDVDASGGMMHYSGLYAPLVGHEHNHKGRVAYQWKQALTPQFQRDEMAAGESEAAAKAAAEAAMEAPVLQALLASVPAEAAPLLGRPLAPWPSRRGSAATRVACGR